MVEVTETDGEGGSSKRKRSVRTERRAGEIGFLAKATAAVNARCKLVPREALERKFAAARPPVDLESLDDEDIRKLSNAELNALEAEVEARIAAEEAEEEANGTKRRKSGTKWARMGQDGTGWDGRREAVHERHEKGRRWVVGSGEKLSGGNRRVKPALSSRPLFSDPWYAPDPDLLLGNTVPWPRGRWVETNGSAHLESPYANDYCRPP